MRPARTQARNRARKDDTEAFLNLSEGDLTPAARGAMQALLSEISDLHAEVGRLKAQLVEVEGQVDRDAL